MAINPESQYPGKVAPGTPDYPFGAARNITVPGDGTGTPWEAALVNDLFGFQQALLSRAGIVPTGTPEKATDSQYLAALERLFLLPVPDITKLTEPQGSTGRVIRLGSWRPGGQVGGGFLRWNNARAKSDHDGAFVFSLTVPVPADFSDSAEVDAYLLGTGETDPSGVGCWERMPVGYITPEMFGAKGDGIQDDYPSWRGMSIFSSGHLLIRSEIKSAEYLINGAINFSNSIFLDMPGVTINKTSGDFDINGALTTLTADLSVSAVAGERAITVTDSNQFAEGDLIIIQNADPFSFSGHRDYYQDGEFNRVISASAGVVTFETAIKSNYPVSSDIQFHKLSTVEFGANGVEFIGVGSDNLLGVDIVENISIRNVSVKGGTNRAFGLRRCYGGEIRGGRFEHKQPASGTNYGISFANCQSISVFDAVTFATRHAIATGGYSGAGAVPCRNINIYTSTLGSSASHSADIHGNAVDCYYHDCIIGGGTGIGGKRCGIKGGQVYPNPLGTAATLQLTEVAGEIEFSGLTAYALDSTGVLAANSSLQMSEITNDYKISFFDSKAVLPVGYSPINIITLVNYADGALVDWDVYVDNITVEGDISSVTRFANWAVTNTPGGFATPPKAPVNLHIDNIHLDDLSGLQFWAVGSGPVITSGVTKSATFPKVSGKVSQTISSGGHSSPGVAPTYPAYPVPPQLELSQSEVGFIGGTRYIAMGKALAGSASIFLTTMHTSETVSANSTSDVVYTVGLDGYRP